MKRLSDNEGDVPFVILNRGEGSLLSHILALTDNEQPSAPSQDDQCWRLTVLEARVAQTYEDRD